MDKITFGKDEYKLLLELQSEVEQCKTNHVENVTKIESLKTLIQSQSEQLTAQKKIIDTMIWASSKVGFFVAGLCGAMVWVGNWLMNVTNFQAVKAFFDTLNKGN